MDKKILSKCLINQQNNQYARCLMRPCRACLKYTKYETYKHMHKDTYWCHLHKNASKNVAWLQNLEPIESKRTSVHRNAHRTASYTPIEPLVRGV